MKNQVKAARGAMMLTQSELADKLNVSRQTIHSIESGKYVPSTVLALKLALVLQQTVEALFQLEEEDQAH
jgi:putative transcriptional regulator